MIVTFPRPHRIEPTTDYPPTGGIPGKLVAHAGDPSNVSDEYPPAIYTPVHAHDRTILKSELPPALQPARAADKTPDPPRQRTAAPARPAEESKASK